MRQRPPQGRRGTRRTVLTQAMMALTLVTSGVLTFSYSASASKDSSRAEVSMLSTAQYGSVLVAGNGLLRGFPLYAFTGDADGTIRCGTTLATGYDLGPDTKMPLTCTGPESDLLKAVKSDDWPAFTTKGSPIAGPGVNPRLLGTVKRRGVGVQVTYAGHPLYLFDPVSKPFDPEGEGYIETVAPLAPWHGYWYLVAASNGNFAPGVATIEDGTLAGGKKVLAVEVDGNVSPIAATVYTYSRDHPNDPTCVDACAVAWVPVLTSGPPRIEGDIPKSEIGTVRRANGTEQVTFKGAPLYLYSKEHVFLNAVDVLKGSGTAGNGEGIRGPGGGVFRRIPLTSHS